MLFIGSCAGTFYALDKNTGQVRWSYDIRRDGKQVSFHGDPLLTGNLILIGTDYNCAPDGTGHVYAFERESGKVRWKYRSTGVPTDIVQSGSKVYFGTFLDKWSSVNLHDAGLNWSFSTGATNESCSPIKSPVADENRLFLIGLDGIIYSLNTASGKVIWKRELASPPSTSLLLQGKTLYVGAAANRIYSLNAETGATLAELIVEAKPVGRPIFAADSLFFFLENASERAGYIISVSPKLNSLRWKQRSSPEWASERPHLWNGLVVAGNCRGEIFAFRASDGNQQWTHKLQGCVRSIGSSRDLLFVGVQEGTVYAFNLKAERL